MSKVKLTLEFESLAEMNAYLNAGVQSDVVLPPKMEDAPKRKQPAKAKVEVAPDAASVMKSAPKVAPIVEAAPVVESGPAFDRDGTILSFTKKLQELSEQGIAQEKISNFIVSVYSSFGEAPRKLADLPDEKLALIVDKFFKEVHNLVPAQEAGVSFI